MTYHKTAENHARKFQR